MYYTYPDLLGFENYLYLLTPNFSMYVNNYLCTYVYQTLKHPLVNPLTVVYYDPIKALPDTSQKKPRVETSTEHKIE